MPESPRAPAQTGARSRDPPPPARAYSALLRPCRSPPPSPPHATANLSRSTPARAATNKRSQSAAPHKSPPMPTANRFADEPELGPAAPIPLQSPPKLPPALPPAEDTRPFSRAPSVPLSGFPDPQRSSAIDTG